MKVSKLGLLWDPLIKSRKFTEKPCAMTMKNDVMFKEEMTCRFKLDMRNLTNFDPSTRKSREIFTLMSIFEAKYIFFELKK